MEMYIFIPICLKREVKEIFAVYREKSVTQSRGHQVYNFHSCGASFFLLIDQLCFASFSPCRCSQACNILLRDVLVGSLFSSSTRLFLNDQLYDKEAEQETIRYIFRNRFAWFYAAPSKIPNC